MPSVRYFPDPVLEVQVLIYVLSVLHRSPQDWNTYQGYLREASQYRDRTATYLTTYPDSTFLYIAQLCLATRGHQEASRWNPD
jgi:hypothetical protein